MNYGFQTSNTMLAQSIY